MKLGNRFGDAKDTQRNIDRWTHIRRQNKTKKVQVAKFVAEEKTQMASGRQVNSQRINSKNSTSLSAGFASSSLLNSVCTIARCSLDGVVFVSL